MGFGLNGNTFYIGSGSTSSAGDTTSFIDDKEVLVEGISISGAGATGNLVLNDLTSTNGAYVAGETKINLYTASNTTTYLDLKNNPLRFPNGIWVSTNSTAVATLIIKRKG
jgi:hypothetical protein